MAIEADNVIKLQIDLGNLAQCPWCGEDTEFYVIQFPDLKVPLFRCKHCKRYWAPVSDGNEIVVKRINRKGQIV